jgi:hypothetical protein
VPRHYVGAGWWENKKIPLAVTRGILISDDLFQFTGNGFGFLILSKASRKRKERAKQAMTKMK